MTDTQNAHLLAHFRAGESITAIEALRKFGCFRLAARINDLKEAGHRFGWTWEKRGGKRFKRYYLERKK